MITLYDYELSAECYQARLMLGVLGLAHERVDVEMYPSRQHESEWFRELSPQARLPVLRDGAVLLDDPHAIATYLARRYDTDERWYPDAPATLGAVQGWLGFARSFAASSGEARLAVSFDADGDLSALRSEAHRLLRALDDHLWFGEHSGRPWLLDGEHPTVADVVLFPDVALSEEGGVDRIDYPAVRRWTDRFKRIDGFAAMSGIFPAGPADHRDSPQRLLTRHDRRRGQVGGLPHLVVP